MKFPNTTPKSTTSFLHLLCGNPHNSYRNFETLNLIFKKVRIDIVANVKVKNWQKSEMADRRVKRGEIWDSGVVVEHI